MSARTTNDDDDLVALLIDLVDTPSVNPSLDATGGGEAAVAALVADWARLAGLDVTTVAPDSCRPNVLVTSHPQPSPSSGPARRPTLLLCAHLDTVGNDDRPIEARRDGDRLHGRGTYDMKAGLAAALMACRHAARTNAATRIVVAAVADEEHASRGMMQVLDHLDPTTIDAAIVTEPTELEVAIAHKGFVWMRVDVSGVAAHGSRPELGCDAIMALGPILMGLDALDRDLATRPHALLGPGSVHASMVTGGRDWSTIPAAARLDIERRTLPGESLAKVERELRQVVEMARAGDPRVQMSVETMLVREPLATAPDDELVTAVCNAARSVTGEDATPAGVSYWADSALLSAAGIPTVLFGPNGDGAHAELEWVSIPGTIATRDVLINVAANLDSRTDR